MTNFYFTSSILKENVDLKIVLETLLDSLHEGVVVIDKDSTVLYVNEAYGRILGVNTNNICGKKMDELEPEANILKVLHDGMPIISEVTIVKSLGVPVAYDAIPIKINNKKIGVIAVFREIEEVMKLSQELKKANLLNQMLKSELSKHKGRPEKFEDIIAVSDLMKNVLIKSEKVSLKETPVLIRGESGTGKEIIARSIHAASWRNVGPFISVNCASIPESLIESELFGYEAGAFTGASTKGKPGVIELAEKGTLFLDEIGDMSFSAQAKFLKVLEEKQVKRVGGSSYKKANFRLITATNQNLERLMKENRFREDLYYRINVVSLKLPSLRQRKSDLRPLIEKIIKEKTNKKIRVSKKTFELLYAYDWPGNVRELENTLEHAIVMVDEKGVIEPNHLPEYISDASYIENIYSNTDTLNNEDNIIIRYNDKNGVNDHIKVLEKDLIKRVLDNVNNKSEAIKKLGLSRRTFYKKVKEYNLW